MLNRSPAPARPEPEAPAEPVQTPAEVVVEKPIPAAETPVAGPRPRPIEKIGRPAPATPGQNWLRPRPVQLNGGRIEISVPYYVGVTAILAVILLVLVAFKIGQGGRDDVQTPSLASGRPPTRRASENSGAPATDQGRPDAPPAVKSESTSDQAPTQGDNWIVLAPPSRQADLEPVVKHFAEHGIELLIVPLEKARATFPEYGLNTSALPAGDGYMLVTRSTYENPEREGTDGYEMKQEIARVGALYKGKAPSGCESFAPNYFRDAYGMKIR